MEKNCCFECGSGVNIQPYHVIPINKGGKNTIPLCEKCIKLTPKILISKKRITITIGEKYNNLTIIKDLGWYYTSGKSRQRVLCKCICGNEIDVLYESVKNNKTKSCGCYRIKNGITSFKKNPENKDIVKVYNIFMSMRQRCYNVNHKEYPNYGGRGIKIYHRWLDKEDGFKEFQNDLGPRPSSSYSLDRIDNDGDYTPENCRWATIHTQQRNRRNNIKDLNSYVNGDFTLISEITKPYYDISNTSRRLVKVKCVCGNILIKKLHDFQPKAGIKCKCNLLDKPKEYDLTPIINSQIDEPVYKWIF